MFLCSAPCVISVTCWSMWRWILSLSMFDLSSPSSRFSSRRSASNSCCCARDSNSQRVLSSSSSCASKAAFRRAASSADKQRTCMACRFSSCIRRSCANAATPALRCRTIALCLRHSRAIVPVATVRLRATGASSSDSTDLTSLASASTQDLRISLEDATPLVLSSLVGRGPKRSGGGPGGAGLRVGSRVGPLKPEDAEAKDATMARTGAARPCVLLAVPSP
mmetsp:Transcript_39802/g.119103  ORF Transcript_39802/g.119103 Transcript_39802/m.119103 type:complete len:222 (+) Transcript_39802:17-682(+)